MKADYFYVLNVCFLTKKLTVVNVFYLSLFFCLQAANTIRSLEGLDRLEHLAKLHLRDNQIEKLDGFSENMKNLQYLNLRWVQLKVFIDYRRYFVK